MSLSDETLIEIPDDFVPTEVKTKEQFDLYLQMRARLSQDAVKQGDDFQRQGILNALNKVLFPVLHNQAMSRAYNSGLDGSCMDRRPISQHPMFAGRSPIVDD